MNLREKIARRTLLRGLGAGVALLGPFARHRLADAAPAGNFMFFASPNGFVRDRFGGQGSGSSWTFKPALAPLMPHKEDVTVIRGLCNKSGSFFNSHEDMCKILTCVHGGGDRFKVYGPSFDHVIGNFLGKRPLTLAVPPTMKYPEAPNLASWIDANRPDTLQTDPLKAYMDTFKGVMPSGGGAPTTDTAAVLMLERKKSLLDFVQEDISLFRGRLTGTDAENLDLYLGSIRDIEKDLVDSDEPLLPPTAGCDPNSVQGAASNSSKTAGDLNRFKAMGEAMLNIAAVGFACGSLRSSTIVWQSGSWGINPLSGNYSRDREHHDISHDQSRRTVWSQIDQWYADRFAYLIGRLKALGILDRTIVAWGSDVAEAHTQNDEVHVVAGGKALGIKTNQNIVYQYHSATVYQEESLRVARDSRHKSLADLWVSIQKALGRKVNHFGDQQYSSGGLQELYSG